LIADLFSFRYSDSDFGSQICSLESIVFVFRVLTDEVTFRQHLLTCLDDKVTEKASFLSLKSLDKRSISSKHVFQTLACIVLFCQLSSCLRMQRLLRRTMQGQERNCVGPEIDPQMEHLVRAAFSVKHDRLWFANGWTIVENGYQAVYSEEFVESFVLIQNVKAINCMLKYLFFQGLSNSNVVLSRATTKLPFVEIAIYPMCRDVPPSCEGGSGSSNNIICINPSSNNAC
jgi:hypothetical protein